MAIELRRIVCVTWLSFGISTFSLAGFLDSASFLCNEGQLDQRVCAYARQGGVEVFATRHGLTFALNEPAGAEGARHRYALDWTFVGGRDSEPVVERRGTGTVSLFLGSQDKWRSGISRAQVLRYVEVWPGIDVVVEARGAELKYSFEARAGADINRIQLACGGAAAAHLEGSVLVLATPLGPLVDAAPIVWQDAPEGRRTIEARYLVDADGTVTFDVGCFDPDLPLVLDPAIIVYAGYIGGAAVDAAQEMAVDSSGAAYVVGSTSSPESSFPVAIGPDLKFNGGTDAVVAKVDPTGSGLVFAGYIGGSDFDGAHAVAVDDEGATYVAGWTNSSNFPVVGGLDPTWNGFMDAFVCRVSPDGTQLEYSGYLGGSANEEAYGIAVDSAERAVIVGHTDSTESSFPVLGGPDLTFNGSWDAFVARVASDGSSLDFSGYVGGEADEVAWSVAVDAQDDIVIAGMTMSADTTFPVAVGPDLTSNGRLDAFVGKLHTPTLQFAYCGYIGGTGDDRGYDVATDGAGRAYMTGITDSDESSFPVSVGPDLSFNGSADAFLAVVRADGTGLDRCGYIGGSESDAGCAVRVDGVGRACVFGWTHSDEGSFPVVDGPDLTYNGFGDAFIARTIPDGSSLDLCGYVGGANFDAGGDGAVDAAGDLYLAGLTESTQSSFPITVGPDLTYNGGRDVFVAKVTEGCAAITVDPQALPPATLGQAYTQQLAASGGTPPYVFSLYSGALPPNLILSSAGLLSGTAVAAGRYSFTVRVTDAAGCYALKGYVLIAREETDIEVGQGHGQPNPNEVRVFTRNGVPTTTDFFPYAAGVYGTNVSSGEIDGVGADRILTGPGPGPTLGPQVRAFLASGQPIAKVNFYAYGTLKYGVNVDGGELDGDGNAELVTGAGPGAVFGPHVRAFDYDGVRVAALSKVSFFAYGTLKYGVNVGSGDVEGDGYDELVTGPGPSPAFAPTARGFDYDGSAIAAIGSINFNAFPILSYGVRPCLGDVDADVRDEMVFTPGPGPIQPAQVRGYDYRASVVTPLTGYVVTPFASLLGARAALGHLSPDVATRVELVCAPGPDPTAAPTVKGFRYDGIRLIPLPWSFVAFPTRYGANVACGALGF